jgi:hypothetical protein
MDLADLAARTGLAVRKLQYVCDHGVLPGSAGKGHGFGVPRRFTEYEAFGVALAAALLDAGVTRRLAAACLRRACEPPAGGRSLTNAPLYRAFVTRTATMEVGGGRYLRVRVARKPGVARALDTGWVPLGTDEPPEAGHAPVVTLTVDLTALAGRLYGTE